MSIIHTVPEDEATGDVAALYDEDREQLGYVPTHSRMMAMNPAAQRGFEAITAAVSARLGVRLYRLVTLAAAEALKSDPCLLAHGNMARAILDDDQIIAVAHDYHEAGLSDAEVAMMDFAVKVCGDSAGMTDADALVLREHGFSDEQIVDIALAASVRNYYSRALHALGVEPDVPPALPAPVRDALLAR
ncbi:MAG: peroxidase-related enzyme [Pseudolysinimonas sp.]